MKYAEAHELLLQQKRLRRRAWKDETIFIGFMPPKTVPYMDLTSDTIKLWPYHRPLAVLGYFVKVCYEGWMPGWRPSASDLLAEDWEEFRD